MDTADCALCTDQVDGRGILQSVLLSPTRSSAETLGATSLCANKKQCRDTVGATSLCANKKQCRDTLGATLLCRVTLSNRSPFTFLCRFIYSCRYNKTNFCMSHIYSEFLWRKIWRTWLPPPLSIWFPELGLETTEPSSCRVLKGAR